MSDQDSPSVISHISIPVSSMEKALAFYDKVLAPLGARRIFEEDGHAVAYGKHFPEFWIHPPHDGKAPVTGNGWHVAFFAASREQVDAFYKAARDAGARDDGAPGGRDVYGPAYYGCFVRDLDGNKIEATYWDAGKEG